MMVFQKSMLVSTLLEAGEAAEAKAIVDELSALKIEMLAPLAAGAQQEWATYNEDADGLEASLDHQDQVASESVSAAIASRNNILSRARVDRFRGKCESALEKLDALVEDKPSTVRKWSYVEERMLCLMELKRFTEAVAVGRAAAARDPGDADIYELLARAYDGAKKPREARKTYTRLLKLWANAEDDYKRMLDARSALLELSARSE
jgi:predicted Zn-dependent protease